MPEEEVFAVVRFWTSGYERGKVKQPPVTLFIFFFTINSDVISDQMIQSTSLLESWTQENNQLASSCKVNPC